ncbi:MAG: glycosyltransferase [Oscillospiraceae bacterium]|jgi:glycosyltransferase involved in cell wall biosynthesis|nr:glycosyltransferase [Oscillospiraceae bacterium]
MKNKNIGILSFKPFTLGGGQKMTLALCDFLCEYFNTFLFSFCKIKDLNFSINKKLKIIDLKAPDARVLYVLTKTFWKFKKIVSSEKIDVLIVSGSSPIPIVWLIKPFIKCKIIFWEHECIANRDKKSFLFRRMACQISDKIVSISKATCDDYKLLLNCQKTELIYNFVDDKIYKNAGEYNLNSKLIISVGRLSHEKGFDLAIDTAKIIFKKHRNWQWHIYGEGSEYLNLEKKIKKNNLEKNLILKRRCDNISQKYKNYAIFVLPSYREGLPLVLLEAKINGIPSVSFDCKSGPNEIISNNINGFLIKCYNTKNMSQKIINLIENKNLRAEFSKNCNLNLEKFNKKNLLKKWKNLINNL